MPSRHSRPPCATLLSTCSTLRWIFWFRAERTAAHWRRPLQGGGGMSRRCFCIWTGPSNHVVIANAIQTSVYLLVSSNAHAVNEGGLRDIGGSGRSQHGAFAFWSRRRSLCTQRSFRLAFGVVEPGRRSPVDVPALLLQLLVQTSEDTHDLLNS
jgi:hypothetical protein